MRGNDWPYEQAAGLVLSRDPAAVQRAGELASAALQQRPTPALLNVLGAAHFLSGRLPEAEEAYRQALDADPAYWRAAWNLAAVLTCAGRPQEAAERLASLQVPEEVYGEVGSVEAALAQVRPGLIGLLRTQKGARAASSQGATSPDGRYVATVGVTAHVRPSGSSQPLFWLTAHTSWVLSVAFSPDGKYLASGSWDHTVRLWEVESGTCLRVMEGHRDDVNSVAFSPDGKYLASGSDDKTVRLWEVESGECLFVFEGHKGEVTYVEFSADGEELISSDYQETRFWAVGGFGKRPPELELDYILCRPAALAGE
jgi:hypothetical protein